MTINKTVYAAGADQWEACCIPGSGLPAQHYNFSLIGGNGASSQRGLLRFDLSTVPYGAIFSSVKLYLYLTGNNATNTHDFYIYRVTSEWDSYYVSYTQRLGGPVNWTSAFGDYADLCSNLAIAWNESVGWKQFEFSSNGRDTLHDMNNGIYNNYGFLVKSSTETDFCQHYFDDPNDTYPPHLDLVYTVPSSAGRTMIFF